MRVAEGKTAGPPRQNQAPAAVAGTARFIARSLLVASRDSRFTALVPPGSNDLYRRLLAEAGDAAFVRAARSRLFRAVFRIVANFLLPGITLHYLARKRCLEDWARRAVGPNDQDAGGYRQVVVLGAGLDTLAWRLHHEQPGVHFIEMDRTAALRVKKSALSTQGTKPPNLTSLAADLAAETLTQTLGSNPAFDPASPTLFLAEGLFMYLPPTRVRSLLEEIAALGAPDKPCLFAFTFMEARADGRIRFRRSNPLVDWWLRRQNEPFRWSISPDGLADFLAPAGWRVRELVSGDTLRSRYLLPAGLRDAPLAMGEWLVLAETTHRHRPPASME